MRKIGILFMISFFFSIYCVDAQTEKGSWVVGGTIALYSLDKMTFPFC